MIDPRALGWVQVAAGLAVVMIIGLVTWGWSPTLLRPGAWIDGSRFGGTETQATMIFAFFGFLILFGMTAALNGARLVRTGATQPFLRPDLHGDGDPDDRRRHPRQATLTATSRGQGASALGVRAQSG